MKERLVILGAGGHGRICAETAQLTGYREVVLLDDNASLGSYVAGPTERFTAYLSDSDFFVAIGNNAIRRRLFERIVSAGGTVTTLIHPSAVISPNAAIGRGCVLMPGVIVNTGTVIGDGAILNTSCSVDHDCRIGAFTHISVDAHLAGTVTIGESTMIGAGAVIINNLTVAENTVVGAGSTVIRNLTEPGVYVGTPAKKIR